MKTLMAAALLCAAMSATADEKTLGTGVTLKEATPIAQLTTDPKAFVGKTIRVDGTATAVVEERGCWMGIAPETTPPLRPSAEGRGRAIVFRCRPRAEGLGRACSRPSAATRQRTTSASMGRARRRDHRRASTRHVHASTAYRIRPRGSDQVSLKLEAEV